MNQNKDFFSLALHEAKKAFQKSEVPIGAVIVKNGVVIAKAHNQTETLENFCAHAEMLAIQRAGRKLKTKYLSGCQLYVTLEPCQMCLYAARLSRLEIVYYLTPSLKFGRSGPAYFKTRIRKSRSNLTQESVSLLQAFFAKRR